MRPDKGKRNRGRRYEKSNDGATQENKVEVKIDDKPEDTQKSAAKETPENAEQNKSVSKDSALTKDENENPPLPALKRETDALKETKKFSKRQIFSNWEKYDEPIPPVIEEEISNSDFDLLLQQNISGAGHFKFKSEQQWENESVTFNQELFTLNLEQLSAGLECIPYYKRLNLPRDLFSEKEVQRMENAAKTQEKFYEKLLNGEIDKAKENVNSSFMGKLKECIAEPLAVNPKFSLENHNQEISSADTGEIMIKETTIGASNDIFDVQQVRMSKGDRDNVGEMKEMEIKLGDFKINEDQSRINSMSKSFVEEYTVSKNEASGIEKDNSKEKESQDVKNEAGAVELDEKKTQEGEITNPTVTKVCENKTQENERRKKRNRGRERHNVEKKTNESAVVNNIEKQTEPLELPKDTISIAGGNQSEKEKSVESDTKSVSSEAIVKEDKTLKIPEVKASSKVKENKSKNISIVKGFEEEEDVLDSLLSLKEPSISPYDTSKNKSVDEENDADNLLTDVSSIVIHEKKENLEEWLDSMLDD